VDCVWIVLLGWPHIVGKDQNIFGQGKVGWVLVAALVGCLPMDVGNGGGDVGTGGVVAGRWMVLAGHDGGGEGKGTYGQVREVGFAAGVQGQGWDTMLVKSIWHIYTKFFLTKYLKYFVVGYPTCSLKKFIRYT